MTELLAGINPACDPSWSSRVFYDAILKTAGFYAGQHAGLSR